MKGEKGISSVCRAGLRIIGFGVVPFLLVSFTACAAGEQITGGEEISIADITSNPTEYEGEAVTISGEYRGWEPGHGSPPVTRSDWVLKDETGAIYVTGEVSPGLDPVEDIGTKITVNGIVRVKDNQSYIEAKIIS